MIVGSHMSRCVSCITARVVILNAFFDDDCCHFLLAFINFFVLRIINMLFLFLFVFFLSCFVSSQARQVSVSDNALLCNFSCMCIQSLLKMCNYCTVTSCIHIQGIQMTVHLLGKLLPEMQCI